MRLETYELPTLGEYVMIRAPFPRSIAGLGASRAPGYFASDFYRSIVLLDGG